MFNLFYLRSHIYIAVYCNYVFLYYLNYHQTSNNLIETYLQMSLFVLFAIMTDPHFLIVSSPIGYRFHIYFLLHITESILSLFKNKANSIITLID